MSGDPYAMIPLAPT